jgi:hypothetical protein
MQKTIYMPLVGEGTECWRPVRAVSVGDDTFEITDKIPEDESWAFSPYSRVRCGEKVLADGHVGQVVVAYAIESHPYYRLLKDHRGKFVASSWLTARRPLLGSFMSTRSMRTLHLTCCPQISTASIVICEKKRHMP